MTDFLVIVGVVGIGMVIAEGFGVLVGRLARLLRPPTWLAALDREEGP